MKVLHYLLYVIAYGFWYLGSLLPMRVQYFFSDILYLLLIYIIRYRRKLVRNNLKTSFPGKTDEEIKVLEKQFYHYFCDYLVETIKLMTMSEEQLRKRMTFAGVEEIEKTLLSGRSVALFLGHYGNWEWITSLPLWVTRDAVCCQLYHPLRNEYFDKLFKFVRERHQAWCIPKNDALRWMVRLREEKKVAVVGYIADQVPKWSSIHHWVDFLHHDTPVFSGSEKLARHNNQVVFYGDVTRVSRGHYNCEFRKLADNPKAMDEFAITDMYFRELEKTIRRNPACYLWSHNRWKRTREEFDKRFKIVNGKVVKRDASNNPTAS